MNSPGEAYVNYSLQDVLRRLYIAKVRDYHVRRNVPGIPVTGKKVHTKGWCLWRRNKVLKVLPGLTTSSESFDLNSFLS